MTNRDRILRAGVNWCAFTHQHSGSAASLAAAREALLIVREKLSKAEGYGPESAIAFDKFLENDLEALLAEIETEDQSLGEAGGSVPSEAP